MRQHFTLRAALDDAPLHVIEQSEGKFLIEVAELSGMKRGEVEQVKANLSRTHDRARGAYGRLAREVPRQFIMIGATNTDQDGNAWYLKDPTGNRRFWPIKTGTIRWEELKSNVGQLWAEAAYREAQGESLVLPRDLWAFAEQEQRERMQREPWIDELSRVFGAMEGRIAVTDARRIISRTVEHWTEVYDRRLGQAMRELGWTRKLLRRGEAREYYYVKGTATDRLVVGFDSDNRPVVSTAAHGVG